MRAFLFLALFSLAAFGQAPKATPTEAKAREVLKVTRTEEMVGQIISQFRQMMPQMMKSMNLPEDEAGLATEMMAEVEPVLRKGLSWERLEPDYVKLYAEAFTIEELDGMLAFYKSPAGKAMISKMPDVLAKSQGLSQKYMLEVMPEVQKKITEVVERRLPKRQ
jgi:hypothetical protein